MENKLISFLVFCIIFISGIFIGESHRGKGTFFISWYGNDLYYGEKVRVKSGLKESSFYNDNCNKMTVVGLHTIDNANEAWVLLEKCKWTTDKYILDTFSQDVLEASR